MCMTDALQNLDSGKYARAPFVWVGSKTENHILVGMVREGLQEGWEHWLSVWGSGGQGPVSGGVCRVP